MRQTIRQLVADIQPLDQLEEEHIQDVLRWIDSGAGIFRVQKPALPDKHLVSYFVLYDEKRDKIMLVNHRKAQLMVPSGGHVDEGEHPKDAATREADEELQMKADFSTRFGDTPLMVTVTPVNSGEHTDVSLWFVIKGDSSHAYRYDEREMDGYAWMTPQEILGHDIQAMDPHMHRFIKKMRAFS
jgi:8-oxo-dGTP diphosphatase